MSFFSVFFFLVNVYLVTSMIFFLAGGNFFVQEKTFQESLWIFFGMLSRIFSGVGKGKSKGILNQDLFVCGGVWMIQSKTIQCEELIVTLEICFVTGR